MQFTPNPQEANTSGVQVLYAYPSSRFKSIGVIDFDYYQPGFREPTVTDAIPELKAKVREAGGNALIVRNQRIGQFNNRFITISAEVLLVARSNSSVENNILTSIEQGTQAIKVPPSEMSVEYRLKRMKELLDQKVITEEEYASNRKIIIASLSDAKDTGIKDTNTESKSSETQKANVDENKSVSKMVEETQNTK